MLISVPLLDSEIVRNIRYDGNSASYDSQLRLSGDAEHELMVFNPWVDDSKPLYFLFTIDNNFVSFNHTLIEGYGKKCIVWNYKGQWLAKYFPRGWIPKHRYKDLSILLPKGQWIKNPDLNLELNFNNSGFKKYQPDPFECRCELIWYLDPRYSSGPDKIWAFKYKPKSSLAYESRDMGLVSPDLPKQKDVIFISYNELNAEENWRRLIEKYPKAKRVHGIEGIFEAHKVAAMISSTEMFYVVDGDAWIVDEFKFNFQLDLYDRDCTYVWASINPLNNLIYGYGGVKLFNKYNLLKMKKWNSLDLTLSVSKNYKFIEEVSNITKFNTDNFTIWKSVFRETVKLAKINKYGLIESWNKAKNKTARHAQEAALQFFQKNKNLKRELLKINDAVFLQKFYEQNIEELKNFSKGSIF